MTNKIITANRLTATGKLDSLASSTGNYLPILLGRMDISMVSDGSDLLGSAATTPYWAFDHANGTVTKLTEGAGSFVRGVFNDSSSGTAWNKILFKFPTAIENEVYIQFYARKTAGGFPKFVKVYGKSSSGSSNTTFKGGDYVVGEITGISYGDGSTTSNDTTFGVSYAPGKDAESYVGGADRNTLPRSFEHGDTFQASEWGDGTVWHKFQFRLKYNSGTTALNEVNDGILESWIDGQLRVKATNIFNRHYSNLPIDYIEFLSYTQGAPAFTMDMKNITISKYGWID